MADQIDTHSQTWLIVKAWAEQRIKQHRAQLETIGLPLPETEAARSALRDMNLLLALPSQKPLKTTHSGDGHAE